MSKDGGSAFPEITTDMSYSRETEAHYPQTYSYGGMSLRDYFASKVLQGFAANPAVFASNPQSGWSLVNCTDADLTAYAYRIADVMLEAREATRKPVT